MSAVSNPPDEQASLTIGDLAERTGIAAGTLRMWETRYGFPTPHRRASGHRRYDERHVAQVLDVVRRRDGGVRLDVAIEQALAAGDGLSATAESDVAAASVFARLRDVSPTLAPRLLTKSTLLGLSWAIEDECCARAQRSHLFGAFQEEKHYASARDRWTDLARTTTSAFAFADFGPLAVASGRRPHLVPLSADNPLRWEWAVVCDSPTLPVVLTAWELPGQNGVRDSERIFETLWAVDPVSVREAARVCIDVAVAAGTVDAPEVAAELAGPPAATADLQAVTALFNRMVAYVDDRRTRRVGA